MSQSDFDYIQKWATDSEKEWIPFLPDEGENKPAALIRVADRARKITLVMRSTDRNRVVARGNRKLIEDNQHQFGTQRAGVEQYGGPVPLFGEDGKSVVGYEQAYRLTPMI